MPIEVSFAQHIGARAEQQDAVGTRRHLPGFHADAVAVVVADGMGGHQGGAEAARVAVDAFLGGLGRAAHAEPTADVLHRATGEAGRAVLDAARSANLVDDMGTTLVGLVAEPDSVTWVSVGDSGVYRIRAGAATRLNTPHTLGTRLDRAVAEGRMSAAEAAGHAQRHALTSYLGKPALEEVDGSPTPLAFGAGDAVLLCSDGLFGALTEAQIAAVVGEGPLESSAERLVAAVLAQARARQDNVTACLVWRTPSPDAGVPVAREAAVAPSGPEHSANVPTPAWRPLSLVVLAAVLAVGSWALWRQRAHVALTPAISDTTRASPRLDSASAAGVQIGDSAVVAGRGDTLGAAGRGDTLVPRPATNRPPSGDTARLRPAPVPASPSGPRLP